MTGESSRSSGKRPFLEDDDEFSKKPPAKRVRFPKGKKVKPGVEIVVDKEKENVEKDDSDLTNPVVTNPIVAAKERAKRMSQITAELFSEDNRGISNDISTAEVTYEVAPQFLLCLLPERKNSDLYGPWKKKNLAEFGIVTQCIAPQRVNDQYLTNFLLKINAKLGGLNSLLGVEYSPSIPIVSKVPTIILGMDVSHGSPRQSDIPSIAVVVSSRRMKE